MKVKPRSLRSILSPKKSKKKKPQKGVNTTDDVAQDVIVKSVLESTCIAPDTPTLQKDVDATEGILILQEDAIKKNKPQKDVDVAQDAIVKSILESVAPSTPAHQKDVDATEDILQDAITHEPIHLLDGPPSKLNHERSDVTNSDTSASMASSRENSFTCTPIIRIRSDSHATELRLASVEEDDTTILEGAVAAVGVEVEEAVDVGTGIDERDAVAGDSINRGGRGVATQEEDDGEQTLNRKRSDASDTSASADSENTFIFVDGRYTDVIDEVPSNDPSLDACSEDVHDDHPKLACDPYPFIDRVDDAAFYSAACSPCRGCFYSLDEDDEQSQPSLSEGGRSTSPNAAGLLHE